VDLDTQGCSLLRADLPSEVHARLRARIFAEGEAGTRCLLDQPDVRDCALRLKKQLQEHNVLGGGAVAVQAIAFDKTSAANWKVTWHQDLMFPFAKAVASEGFALASVKQGIDYARPPTAVLERMLAVRVHLDLCDENNGPLRVVPGSHRRGIIPSREIDALATQESECVCLAHEGEMLLMRPLLLHASSQAKEPRHRRVLHLVYYDGLPISELWHREV
jgi:ectoine hydroxylase-related dioxygenase (phytanoyl-CoA dioxygenase family)